MKNDRNPFLIAVPTALGSQDDTRADIASGELGIFNARTGVVIDADPGAPLAKEIQFIMNSANQGFIESPVISLARLNSVTKQAYAAGEPAKITVTLPAIGTDTDAVIEQGEVVGVKIAIEAGDSYQHVGMNRIWKHFYVDAKSTANLTAAALVTLINADDESIANGGFILASASTNVVTITFAFTNDDASIPVNGKTAMAVPSHTSITVNDNITGTVTTAFSFAQGKGAYIQTLEKMAAGYINGSGINEYRYLPGDPTYPMFTPDAVVGTNYTLYVLNFDIDFAENIGLMNNFEFMIATASSGVVTALDAFFAAISFKGRLVGF